MMLNNSGRVGGGQGDCSKRPIGVPLLTGRRGSSYWMRTSRTGRAYKIYCDPEPARIRARLAAIQRAERAHAFQNAQRGQKLYRLKQARQRSREQHERKLSSLQKRIPNTELAEKHEDAYVAGQQRAIDF